jgi:predicted Zn-dependent peptidase
LKIKDSKVLDMISYILIEGKSSRMYKKIVDDKKMALRIGAINLSLEDYGMYIVYGLPMGEVTTEDLNKEIDEEIVKLQNELISEREYQKLMNAYENQFVSSNSSAEDIASSLANYYTIFGDASLINKQLEEYRSITREDIQRVAKTYLNPNQRLILDYVPTTETAKN